jgi:hypothetical protein
MNGGPGPCAPCDWNARVELVHSRTFARRDFSRPSLLTQFRVNRDMEETPPAKPKTFFHRAAAFCLWAPLIGILLNVLCWVPGRAVHPPATRMDALADATVSAFVPVLGFLAGIVSLFGIRRYGRTGILWKALTGMTIFLLMIAMAIPALLKARDVARQRYEQRYGHPPP